LSARSEKFGCFHGGGALGKEGWFAQMCLFLGTGFVWKKWKNMNVLPDGREKSGRYDRMYLNLQCGTFVSPFW